MSGILSNCAGQLAPTNQTVPVVLTPAPVPPPAPEPTPTPTPTPPPGPVVPGNPGDAVNCGNFSTWQGAQNWFDTYYPYYGDVANLDSDGDRIALRNAARPP
jgi:hypothetical protein